MVDIKVRWRRWRRSSFDREVEGRELIVDSSASIQNWDRARASVTTSGDEEADVAV